MGSSNKLDGRPGPASPVWYAQGWWMVLRCGCGHRRAVPVGPFAIEHRVPRDASLSSIHMRLRCQFCGKANPDCDLVEPHEVRGAMAGLRPAPRPRV